MSLFWVVRNVKYFLSVVIITAHEQHLDYQGIFFSDYLETTLAHVVPCGHSGGGGGRGGEGGAAGRY